MPRSDTQNRRDELADRHPRRNDTSLQVERRLCLGHAAPTDARKDSRKQDTCDEADQHGYEERAKRRRDETEERQVGPVDGQAQEHRSQTGQDANDDRQGQKELALP